MRVSYYGWCCAHDCEEEATARAQMSFGDSPILMVPVCDEHLVRIKASIEALRGADLVALEKP